MSIHPGGWVSLISQIFDTVTWPVERGSNWAGNRQTHPSRVVSPSGSKEDWDEYYVDALVSTSSEPRLARGDNRHQSCPLYRCWYWCSRLKKTMWWNTATMSMSPMWLSVLKIPIKPTIQVVQYIMHGKGIPAPQKNPQVRAALVTLTYAAGGFRVDADRYKCFSVIQRNIIHCDMVNVDRLNWW